MDGKIDLSEAKQLINEMGKAFDASISKREKSFRLTASEENAAKLEGVKKFAKTAEYFKALAEGDTATLKAGHNVRAKALSEGTTTAGGYLVPEEFEREVLRLVEDYSVLRKLGRVIPMGSDTLNLSTLTTDVSVVYVAESTKLTESTPAFGQPTLTARKLAAITAWSNELAEDSAIDLLGLLAERYAQAIALKEQNEFLNGTTSGSEGIFQVSGIDAQVMGTGDTSFANIAFDDLRAMETSLMELTMSEARNASFIMSPYVWNVLMTIKEGTSLNSYVGGSPLDRVNRTLFGYNVHLVNEAPNSADDGVSTKFVGFADWSKHLIIGDRSGIRTKILSEGTVGSNNLGEKDMEALRVIKRTANTVVLPARVGTLATAAS